MSDVALKPACSRNAKIDYLRVIGTILVILAHVELPKYFASVRSFDVVLLFFVSGVSYAIKPKSGFQNLKSRVRRLLLPTYLLISFIFLASFIVCSLIGREQLFSTVTIIRSYFFYNGFGYIWIVNDFIFAISVMCFYCIYHILNYYFGNIEPLYEMFFLLFPYLIIVIIGMRLWLKPKSTIIIFLLISVAAFLASLFVVKDFIPNSFKYPATYEYLSYGLLISIVLFLIIPKKGLKPITWLSKNSFEIYLFHIVFITVFNFLSAYDSFRFLSINWLQFILVLVASICSVLLYRFLMRMIGVLWMKIKKYLSKKFPMLKQRYYEIEIRIIAHSLQYKNEKQKIEKLKRLYKKHNNRDLNLEKPMAYTEKIQWRKIYDNQDIYSSLSDKYLVRQWVKEKIGESYLIPLLGVWDCFDEIDFSTLPDSFVLKTNNASGTNVIVTDKNSVNRKLLKRKFDFWMKMKYEYLSGYESHYSKITPKIIAEEFISTPGVDLQDYKFLCFNGTVKYIWVDTGRYHNHKRTVFNREWEIQPWQQFTYDKDYDVKKPNNLEEMILIAEKLASGFDHVRVDLYNNDGIIYFGEMTFTNGSGFEAIYPPKYDYVLGEEWKLTK